MISLHLAPDEAIFLAAELRRRCEAVDGDGARLAEIRRRLETAISDERERTRAAMPIAP